MPENNSIGAMWVKQGKSGPFYSGYVEFGGQRIEIIAFKNDTSKNPKTPSLRILKSTPREPIKPVAMPGIDNGVSAEDIPF